MKKFKSYITVPYSILQYEYGTFKAEQYYLRGSSNYKMPKIFDPFIFIVDQIGYTSLKITCKIKGHQWTDCSSVGPESGNMDMECKRCGKTFHHILY